MVSLDQARSSNARIASELPSGLVAVFVGGTGAVGGTTLRQFVKHAIRPRVYFLGRSQESGNRITAELKELNADGDYCFISADVSLFSVVDDVCREIKTREKHVNLLFMTTGTVRRGEATREGLDYHASVTYYSRIRFIVNLLPLLQRAPSLRRVVTVLAGTKEGQISFQDLSGQAAPLMQLRGHFASMMTLALESIALEAPDVSFVHSFPGSVKIDLGKDVKTAPIVILRLVFKVIGPLVNLHYAEAGEWQLFLSTSRCFAPKLEPEEAAAAGVSLHPKSRVSIGSNGMEGSGVYSVNYDGEAAPEKIRDAVMKLRAEDAVRKLWLHTEETFTRVTGTTFVV